MKKEFTNIFIGLMIINFISSNTIDINKTYKTIENYQLKTIGKNKLKLNRINNIKFNIKFNIKNEKIK